MYVPVAVAVAVAVSDEEGDSVDNAVAEDLELVDLEEDVAEI